MIFSEKLQLIRKNKGVTQEQLAEKLDVSRQDSHDYSYSDENTIGIVECILLTVQCILLLVSIFLTENTLKKTLNDDGTHK